jgi:YfiR/HmsC-like
MLIEPMQIQGKIAVLSNHGLSGHIWGRLTPREGQTTLDEPRQVAANRWSVGTHCRRFLAAVCGVAGRSIPVERCCAALILAALALCARPATSGAQDDTLERAVKVTYLYKFAPFVDWPDPTAEFPSGEFRICVVGGQMFLGMLDRAVQGRTVAGRPIAIQRFSTVTGNPGCSVMFVTGPDAQSVAQTLAVVRGSPVLTVTDGAQEPDVSGIINFVIEDSRVRFEINAEAAAANRLTISSKLLNLATRVTGRGQTR